MCRLILTPRQHLAWRSRGVCFLSSTNCRTPINAFLAALSVSSRSNQKIRNWTFHSLPSFLFFFFGQRVSLAPTHKLDNDISRISVPGWRHSIAKIGMSIWDIFSLELLNFPSQFENVISVGTLMIFTFCSTSELKSMTVALRWLQIGQPKRRCCKDKQRRLCSRNKIKSVCTTNAFRAARTPVLG